MAILVIESKDLSRKLEKFEIKCKECGSDDVEIEIDWAAYPSASWNKTTLICKNCKADETLIDDN